MQQYSQIILFFYRKVVSQHRNKITHLRELNNLLQKTNLSFSRDIKDRNGQKNVFAQGDKYQHINVPQNICQLKTVYSTLSFEKCLLFTGLNKIITSQSLLKFKILKDKIRQLTEMQNLGKNAKRIVLQEWQKMYETMSKNEWQINKQLCQSIERMPMSFYECLTQMFCRDTKKQQTDFKDSCMAAFSFQLHLKVIYYQLEENEIIKKKKFGSYGDQCFLCYVYDIGKYIVCEKAPEQIKKASK